MRTTLRLAIAVGLAMSSLPALALAGPVHFGVKGGLAITNLDPKEVGSSGFELESKKGPVGGAFATWGFNQRLAVQGELLYVSKGFSYGESEATDNSGNLIGKLEALQTADYL